MDTSSTERFLKATFRNLRDDEVICISRPGKKGHIQTTVAAVDFKEPFTWYACIATVDAPGPRVTKPKLKRKKENCRRVFTLMLDDIGTKGIKAPPLEPSAIIETSAGNHQFHYFLEPTGDFALFEALVDACARKGWSDKGAAGCNRIFRLPGAVHFDKGFEARLRELNPERIWTLDELIKTLDLDVTPASAWEVPEDFNPADYDDKIAGWMVEQGYQPDKGGYYLFPCPWEAEHSEPSSLCNYHPVSKRHPGGHYHCFHAHEGRDKSHDAIEVAMEELGVPSMADTMALIAEHLREAANDRDIAPFLAGLKTPQLVVEVLPDLIYTEKRGVASRVQNCTVANITRACEVLGIELHYNLLTKGIAAVWWGEILDPDNSRAAVYAICDALVMIGIRNRADVLDMLMRLARRKCYHPMEQWILSRAWDGTSRLDELYATLEVTEAAAESGAYVRRWLIQGVECVRGWHKDKPQQKAGVLVFIGGQGDYKTRWFEALAPEFFGEAGELVFGAGGKDSQIQALSKSICELGELDTVFKKTEVGHIKNFISKSTDTYRKPYGREYDTDHRTTSFCGTCNDAAFLRDSTGSRRFWPIAIHRCNVDHAIDVQQVWAEVSVLWDAGEQWWLTEDEEKGRMANEHIFTQAPAIIEVLAHALAHTEVPEKNWLPMKATDVAEVLGYGRPSPLVLGEVRIYLNKNLRSRKTMIRGVRDCWLLPPDLAFASTVKTGSYLRLIDDEEED